MRLATCLIVLARSGTAALAQLCAPGEWEQRVAFPPARDAHAVVFDAQRGVFFEFGGRHPPQVLADSWSWNDAQGLWKQSFPGTQPSERRQHAMAYDAGRGVTVLFGGIPLSGPALGDTWEWNGTQWTQRAPASGPSARVGHAMAYYPPLGTVVLYGGTSASAVLGDIWEWDGAAGTWTQRQPGPLFPPARTLHAMTLDSTRNVLVVFGGQIGDYNSTRFDDTWELTLNATSASWVHRLPSARPYARAGHGLGYDALRQRVVLFGGHASWGVVGDTWEWNPAGGPWVERTPVGSPPPRDFVPLVGDPAGHLVLHGGSSPTGQSLLDTWSYIGASGTWTQRAPAPAPPARYMGAMAYDPTGRECVLFGGQRFSTGYLSDTWTWDGDAWTLQTPPVSPAARILSSMTFDAGRNKVVLFGGRSNGLNLNDLWEWDGASQTWQDRSPAERPAARQDSALAFDELRGTVLLFGGSNAAGENNETWEWDGAAGLWTRRFPSVVPAARSGHRMAFDRARGVIVMHGGFTSAGATSQTWEWDGGAGTWTQRGASSPSGPRTEFLMEYSEARGRVVIFAGYPASTGLWEWDGVAGHWLPLAASHAPLPRWNFGGTYDSQRDRLVLFSGEGGLATVVGDTWEQELGCPCYANCDQSSIEPILNVLDFNCFLNRFSAGDAYANCDASTIAPVLNVLDFNCFLNRFSAGCP